MRELARALGFPEAEIELAISGERGLTLVIRRSAGDARRAVIRVHRGDGPNRVAREYQVLSEIVARAERSLAITVPEPLARAPWGPGEAAAFSYLEGRPLRPAHDPMALRSQLEHVRVWLADLWILEPPEAIGPVYALGPALDGIEAEVGALGPRVVPAWRRVRECAARLDAAPPVFCHFDLAPGNLLLTALGVRALDWEYARRGHRFYDWFRFVTQVALGWRQSPPSLGGTLVDDERILAPVRRAFFERGELSRVVASETIAALALGGVDPVEADSAMRAALLHYLALQLAWRERRSMLELLLTAESVFGRAAA